MPIGPRIREMLGPFEISVANMYRSYFLDIDLLTDQIKSLTDARHILEIGCGEGAVTQKLAERFPTALITGIDITPRIGRLFRGDTARVTFKQQTVAECANEQPHKFDLAVICDVLHHVPPPQHMSFMEESRRVIRRGGVLFLKDWEPRWNVAHLLCYISDSFITGDRVKYKSLSEMRQLTECVFGPNSIEMQLRIAPQANNYAFLVRNQADAGR